MHDALIIAAFAAQFVVAVYAAGRLETYFHDRKMRRIIREAQEFRRQWEASLGLHE